MKKFILAAAIVIGLGGYFYWSGAQASAPISTALTSDPTTSGTSDTVTNSDSSGATPPPTTSNNNQGLAAASALKDGTYTGTVANSIFGGIQVSAVIQSGKLVDVKMLEFPNDQPHSTEVSNMSLPQLKTEAIAAQSANVSAVSGATQTSEAFTQSLQSALVQAQG